MKLNSFNMSENEQERENKTLFDLPYPVLCNITASLSLRDALAFSCCCKQAYTVVTDQYTWRQRLWYWGKAVNVCMAKNSSPKLKEASAVISDPLLLNLRTLYYVLSPCGCRQQVSSKPRVDVANLLAKLDPANSANPNFMHNVLKMIARVLGHRVAVHNLGPLHIGAGESRYMLFSPPETRTVKSLMMSLVASRSSVLETVGLVEGRPGGIGSGVTVQYEPVRELTDNSPKGEGEGELPSAKRHILNLLPLRRVTPRLMTPEDTEGGVRFISEVAEVVRCVEGIICVLDAECRCHLPDDATNSAPSTTIDGHRLQLMELEAMMRTIPASKCPVFLILMANYNPPPPPALPPSCEDGPEGVLCDNDVPTVQGNGHSVAPLQLHKPYLLKHVMDPLHIPWAAFEVEVSNLRGLSLAFNWLVRRTNAPPTSTSQYL